MPVAKPTKKTPMLKRIQYLERDLKICNRKLRDAEKVIGAADESFEHMRRSWLQEKERNERLLIDRANANSRIEQLQTVLDVGNTFAIIIRAIKSAADEDLKSGQPSIR